MSPPKKTRTSQNASRGPPLPIKLYLVLYNILSFYGWGHVLFLVTRSLLDTKGDVTKSYGASSKVLQIVQTAALMEVLHALIGFVKAPVVTTIMQVASRIFMTWGVTYSFNVPEVRQHWAFSTMVIAWCVADMIRYLYYAFSLFGSQPGWLVWCRYTFFYVLYPMGAFSEWVLIVRSLNAAKALEQRLYYVFIGLAIYWPLGLFQMYNYMRGQRRKYLGSRKSTKKVA
ncbi:hypothetical protein HK104_002262 [Borealophlyctis nickersoniae]|nr:hypothetical protein HK104_002262 [Borealophlyctis nickersoniae]